MEIIHKKNGTLLKLKLNLIAGDSLNMSHLSHILLNLTV